MRFKFIVTLLIALFVFTTGEAAKVDMYREAIENRTFTIKYKISTFPVRMTNREINVNLGGGIWGQLLGQAIKNESHFIAEATADEGIIVFDKDNSYVEGNFRRLGQNYNGCALRKDGEIYSFRWEIKDGVKQYYGSSGIFGKTKKVKAISEEKLQESQDKYYKYQNPYELMYANYIYGNMKLTQALVPILPPDKVIASPITPVYEFVGSGNLSDGVSYEDFACENSGVFNAIRYYFNGEDMIRIAMFNYVKDAGRIQSYEKYVVDIEEFSTTPDKAYLELPDELIDKTKRE